ncbi:MAG: hypothetical protein RR514_07050 [Christensenella sp.]
MKEIRIAVCTEGQIYENITNGIHLFEEEINRVAETDVFLQREELLYGMRKKKYDIIIVDFAGALGMEAVIGARDEDGRVSIIWISDEEFFALQSYRMQTAMFLVKPVTAEQVKDALCRCTQ